MMKKIIFSCAFVALIITACTQNGYKISGTFDNPKQDSLQVILSERINREWKDLDSTRVVNGKFEFQGKADSVKVGYIRLKTPDGENKIGSFILEPGQLKVKVDTAYFISVTGTPQNEILAKYFKEEQALSKKGDDIIKKYSPNGEDTNLSDEARNAMNSELKVVENDLHRIAYEYCMNHVNTMVGSHIFMNTFYYFTTDEKEKLFAKMDSKTKSIPRIAELIAATEVEKKTAVGQPYVNFTLQTPDGKSGSLSDYVGKTDYLLVDFWASWCGPCIHFVPELKAFYTKNKGPKFDIISVSLDKNKEDWVQAIQKFGLSWHHLSDLKYWQNEAAKQYAVNSIPATVLIDKKGKIVGRNMELNDIQKLINQ